MRFSALILEDSATQAAIIRKMVETRGWSALHYADVKEALDAIQVMDVRALFLDVYVGDRNTLKHFDRFRLLATQAVIALMTAGSKATSIDETLAQARKYQADYLLPKPFTETQVGDVLTRAEKGGPLMSRHVLVIDDSRTVCLFVKTALEAEGYRVSVAPSMETAFSNVDIAHVDLVLCDVFMPGMGGLNGMRSIRTTWPKVRLISMSAGIENKVTSLEALNASRRIGVHGQIGKPFTKEDLIEVVDAVLDPHAISTEIRL
ncbi:response regulator [Asticcacaulis biprosthecium C19]|uniref:Response regulator n=1 Tax=Asticcacaulis biprosthecium C19 TaxID=715226 RepID=F4QGX8_9CAUL|nr:response regulator [Asticcacaulis biprosthecium]EGF93731.1 response regulator [Asticcacaulis biprosthecium C19]